MSPRLWARASHPDGHTRRLIRRGISQTGKPPIVMKGGLPGEKDHEHTRHSEASAAHIHHDCMSSFLPSWSGFSISSANVTARQRYLSTGEGSPAEKVPGVQPQRQGEERQVDREEIGGKPARQV